MKTPSLLPFTAFVLFAASGCDKQSPDTAKKIAELEQKNNAAAERQRELEQQIEDQKLAAERDAIERERADIEEDRAELERQQGEAAAEQDEALRQREEAIAKREGRLEEVRESLEQKEDDLSGLDQDLTERDRELVGREALDFEVTEQNVPVGDYGTFYDSLSSYGSWFETSDYGYVWQPAVVREVNWRPYSRGRWICSDRGWTWVSDEPFGWATYHYGRWALITGRGWVWVPGSEWAPCWVSWRENDSHIGWAPLPPETMAYHGRGWDSTVDVQFGIGAICFNFVEIRHFGSPIFRRCLPTAANFGFFDQTKNITHIYIQNRYVISGGPRYQKISERIGRPIPFYRLEVDHHPRPGRDQLAMRPQVRGGKLRIAAPNMDADWNDSLRPRQVRGRIETVNVERNGVLNRGITDKFRESREEGRQRAEKSIADLGGPERFEERRTELLSENRREVEGKLSKAGTRATAKNPERPNRDVTGNPDGPKVTPPSRRNPLPDGMIRPDTTEAKVEPREPLAPDARERRPVGERVDGPRVAPAETAKRQEVPENRRQAENRNGNGRQAEQATDTERETGNRKQQEQAQQRQAEQAREAQNEEMRRRQDEQKQQRQEEQARKQAMEEQREQARQQQAENEARRQQQELREMQRQQEQAQQRQQEESRQREQEQARQQQQEQARQREQEESRQREQEQSRQREQERAREQRQKDDDEQKKRNR
ncbi:MAG: DUF6600 domain-containing protein [Verrucomicrobiota bacterium]